MGTKHLFWWTIVVLLLVGGVAIAQTTYTASPILFTGQVGIGPGAGNQYGLGYPLGRLDVNGDTNTRIRIDGRNTTGIYFTLGGADAGTIRSTASGIEVWTSDKSRMLVLKGMGAHFLGSVQVDGSIAAKYQDVAEWVTGPSLPAGTVVVGLEANRVIASHKAYDPYVVGVVSERPGILLGERGATKIKVAHSGRVRVKVVAPVAAGDLLVASAEPGHAMRGTPREILPGTVLGKALESLEMGRGEILMLLTLQ